VQLPEASINISRATNMNNTSPELKPLPVVSNGYPKSKPTMTGPLIFDKYKGLSQIEKFNSRYGDNDTSVPKTEHGGEIITNQTYKDTILKESNPNESSGKRNKWDDTKIKQFLDDCDKKSLEDVSTIYNLDKRSVYSLKYKFKNSIKENKDGDKL
jgi:hypothetical protein